MLLDDLMPEYDVVERHRTIVRATPDTVFAAIRVADLRGGPVTRTLLALRALPAAGALLVRSPRALGEKLRVRRQRRRRPLRLADLECQGFRVVAERAPEELVIGLVGRFWTPGGGLAIDVSEASFRAGPPPGFALAGWNFTVVSRGSGLSELGTETRVWCAADARWKFRLYWLAVRPGSGLIRRAMLQAIRREAEMSSP